MPLHLNSLANLNEKQKAEIMSYILGPAFSSCNSAFATQDKRHFIARSDVTDMKSGRVIGQFVYTIWSNLDEQRNEILDLDIALCNENTTSVRFLDKLPSSSESNEHYLAESEKTGQYFQLETMCRYTVAQEIVNTERNVYISVFPFELNLYDSISSFNREVGFKKHHPIGNTGFTTEGLSDICLAPGGVFSPDRTDEVFSFIVGTVGSYEDVSVNFGKINIDFVIAQVRTALGIIPVAMGRNVFNIKEIKPGVVVVMNADVKADLSKPGDFLR